ncbi:SDR family NAD(P)-dependent oxidoreductase, partial [Streptomyces sp. DSM 44917]
MPDDTSEPVQEPAALLRLRPGELPWVLSAPDDASLRAAAGALRRRLGGPAGADPTPVARALAASDRGEAWRAVLWGEGAGEVREALARLAGGEGGPAGPAGSPGAGPAFLFPGQGPQWAGMALGLRDASPAFAAGLRECAGALAPHVDWSLDEVLAGAPGAPGLTAVEVVQPALFAVMAALAGLWRAAGVEPAAVAGYCFGEVAAAHVAGALTLPEAALVVTAMARAQAAVAGRGAMASVLLPEAEAAARLAAAPGALHLAAVTGPRSCVVSGAAEEVDAFVARCAAEGVRARRVAVDVAGHSPGFDALRAPLLRELGGLRPRRGRVAFHSSLTGTALETTALNASYWWRLLRRTARLDRVANGLLGAGHRLLVEITPHPVLAAGFQDAAEESGANATIIPSLHRGPGEHRRFTTALAEAYAAGAQVRWPRVLGPAPAAAANAVASAGEVPSGEGAAGEGASGADASGEGLPGVGASGGAVTGADACGGQGLAAAGAGAAGACGSGERGFGEEGPGVPPGGGPGAERRAGAALRGRLAGLSEAAAERVVLRVVLEQLAAVTGGRRGAAVNPGVAFRELGVDSAAGVQLRARLARETGLRLPAALVFEEPTPAALARRLLALLSGERPDRSAPEARGAGELVAVVALGCRLPGGVRAPEDLWRLLEEGRDAVGAFPGDRGWDHRALLAPDAEGAAARPGAYYQARAGFLDGAGEFDAAFFGIPPREALAMDPQQRLLLTTAWETLERAGIDPTALRGTDAGVFVGAMDARYGPGWHRAGREVAGHLVTGNLPAVASGRIAYALGLRGPAVTVDTACSASLVALHLARRALLAGECSLALAGGATVLAGPGPFAEFSRQRALSHDGRCKAFSEAADGFGLAEGVGLVLLERLGDARRNGHPVLAVLRGSAVNQDGASNGLSAPSGRAQEEVIRRALADAGLGPGDVDLAEAHGTGTRLGDPVEAGALLAVYGRGRPPGRPLWLGSVKSNLGHTQAAAGVTGVIKAVLALRHGTMPRTLHAERPAGAVDWSPGGVRLLTERRPWPEGNGPRRAAVSSFGISGTNAHVILEQPPEAGEEEEHPGDTAWDAGGQPADGGGPFVAWPLSGRGEEALRAQAGRLRAHLEAVPDASPAGIGRALATTRAAFEDRAVVIGRDRAALAGGLAALEGGTAAPGVPPLTGGGVVRGRARARGPVVFVFPGQGGQWPGMAAGLLESSPVFRERIAACDAALAAWVDWSLEDVLRRRPGAPPLERVEVVQPALFAVMVALAEVWRAHGVRPDAVVGHSQGEIAAACVAGALALPDAARVVALRSALIAREASGRGGMLSAALGAAEARRRLQPWEGRIALAAENGPRSVVLSGEPQALDALAAALEAEGVRAARLPVDYAAHGPQVEAVRGPLAEALSGLAPRRAAIPLYSTVTGAPVDGERLDAAYWADNLRRPVRFLDAVRRLLADEHRVFVEVGPHPVLTAAVEAAREEAAEEGVVVCGTLRREDGGPRRMLTSLAQLHVRGVPVDWRPAFPGAPARPVPLPTYAFRERRFWLPAEDGADAPTAPSSAPADAAEARVWEAVEREDAEGLADALGAPGAEALIPALPALAAWRRAHRRRAAARHWRYRVVWEPARPAEGAPQPPRGHWLLVAPPPEVTPGVVERCAAALAELGGTEVLRPGDDAGEPGSAAQRAGLAGELRRTAGRGAAPVGVLSLLALDERPLPGRPGLTAGAARTLALIQALGDAGIPAPLWLVTAGAVAVAGDEGGGPSPAQAMAWGLGRVAGLEHPERWGGLLDLPPDAAGGTGADLARALSRYGPEDQLALRGGQVLARRLVRAPLPEGRGAGPGLRGGGTALVTGGTGALGAHVARRLAREGAERVVLVSRRGPDAPGAAGLAAGIEALGARAHVAACDVADPEALAALAERLREEGPPVRTVVHAAGLAPLVPLAGTDGELLAGTVRAKVAGAAHLDALFQGPGAPGAFVLFSSIAGVWGSADHAAYGAANAALEALAARRRARGLPATCVAWGIWDPESGGGMAAGLERDRLLARGVRFMDPGAALDALADAVEHEETSVAVCDVDWERFAPAFAAARPRPLLAGVPEARAPAGLADAPEDGPEGRTAATGAADEAAGARGRLAGLPPERRERALRELVRGHAAAALGHAGPHLLDPDRPFRAQGLDSVTAVDLRNRLAAATGLRLPVGVVFDHPTVAELAGRLSALLAGPPPAAPAPAVAPEAPPAPAASRAGGDPVAVVAAGCRLPGGIRSPEELWALLAEERDVIGPFPADRGWDLAALLSGDPRRPGFSAVSEGGFLADAADFDAGFFGISPREAAAMDPQQRLLLTTVWETAERAGLNPATLHGSRTGVFVGAGYHGYGAWEAGAADEAAAGHVVSGTAMSVVSGRVAYALGLSGPAVTVDTACSSSLVALHLAVQAVRRGECRAAFAAGTTVIASPLVFTEFSRLGGLAADGRCKAFSEAADGMGLAEGVVVLLLQRLSDARREGRRVLAVVRGTATNQDGASNGLTAPSGPAQQAVIRLALADAGLAPDEVDAVEAHGTGTTLGDPIEAQALAEVYGRQRPDGKPLLLRSVKSALGHTQATSGLAGALATVLALRHGALPRSLHLAEPSRRVPWAESGLEPLAEARPWPRAGRPRRAGVSSFGLSGTNAHVILEEGPDLAADGPEGDGGHPGVQERHGATPGRALPWVVSGLDGAALRAQAARLHAHLTGRRPGPGAAAVAHALVETRAHLPHRAVVLGRDREALLAGLASVAAGRPEPGLPVGEAAAGRKVVFVFPGQGGQWPGMAAGLLERSPAFAERLAACERALTPLTGWSPRAVLLGEPGAPPLERVDVVQPVLFAVMVSLAALWRLYGVEPDAVTGHSQGEIAAACVAGGLSLEDAARVVAVRSRLVRERLAGRGAMASVALPAAEARRRLAALGGDLSLAAVNGPDSVVLSGEPGALDSFLAACAAEGVRARRVPVDYASHSAQVEETGEELRRALDGICPAAGHTALYSTVTGGPLETGALDAAYWVRNLRRPVEFAATTRRLLADGHDLFVEVSPHPVLLTDVQEAIDSAGSGGSGAAAVGTLRRGEGDPERFLRALGEAYVRGAPVRWERALPGRPARLPELPTYAFQERRYWPSRPAPAADGGDASGRLWAAVEREDAEALAAGLGGDAAARAEAARALGPALPLLARLRREDSARARADAWRYRVAWVPAPESAA